MLRHGWWGVALASVALSALLGCSVQQSGNPPDDTGASGVAPAGHGGFTISVTWPDATAELIPQSSQSIAVEVTATSTDEKLADALLTRDTPSVTFDDLPPGTECLITATAYPIANGTGTAQASGDVIADVPMGAVAPLRLTLGTAITTVVVNPTSVPLTETDPGRQLTATARNADGDIVLTSGEWTFESLDPSIVSVTEDGLVEPGALGTTTVRVSEPESGVSAGVRAGTAPRYVSPDIYKLSGGAGPDWSDSSRCAAGLNAIMDVLTADPTDTLQGLTNSNFYLVEDGFLVDPINVLSARDAGGAVDICFVIDSTGSMYGTIDGVIDSVVSFADELTTSSGLSVRLAGVDYGDEVRTTQDFTSDVDDFRQWVQSLSANGGADLPENPLDAVIAAYDTFRWRGAVQKTFIILTDAPAWQVDCPGNEGCTTTMNETILAIRGSATVFAVSPGTDSIWYAPGAGSRAGDEPDYPTDEVLDVQILAEETGGLWTEMPYDGYVDLTQLPIADTIADGWVVRYQGVMDDTTHSVRVVLALDGEYVGDAMFSADY